MTNFTKKQSISKIDNSYQVVATGNLENRTSIITKFANQKTWCVVHKRDNDIFDENYFTTLSEAKDSASNFVTYN